MSSPNPNLMDYPSYIVEKAKYERRAKEFQAMHNPMKMSPFEQMQAKKDVQNRKDTRSDYTRGIQGRDGGCTPGQQEPQFDTMF